MPRGTFGPVASMSRFMGGYTCQTCGKTFTFANGDETYMIKRHKTLVRLHSKRCNLNAVISNNEAAEKRKKAMEAMTNSLMSNKAGGEATLFRSYVANV